ncbi:LPXTG cell wall anchor domain-containing protein [Catellatospora sichuanensis]|uniref:LPXTG cell wall anchor domain-containing protein n=1 Tax=Catellatospora sichuanensis TaxID=1969805 RepID=UPI001FEA9316|nr:LPXTG cell wall anchor domain-containing protein [Catellatospora sichuanensis]
MKISTALAAGASMLLAGGLSAVLGTPAHAAGGVDLAVSVPASKIAVEAEGKGFRVDLSNVGTAASGDALLTYDFNGLTSSLVAADLSFLENSGCDITGKVAKCHLYGFAPGESYTDAVYLRNVGKAAGAAGSFSVSFTAAGDVNTANNTVTVPVQVVDSGADLMSYAFDVVAGYTAAGKVIPVKPGASAPLAWGIHNNGDRYVHGLEFTITLPPHVIYDGGGDYPGWCGVDQTLSVITCSAPDVVIPPGGSFTPESPTKLYVLPGFVDGPAALPGGLVSAKAIKTSVEEPAAGELKSVDGFKVADEMTEQQFEQLVEGLLEGVVPNAAEAGDVDPADDDASFAVHAAAAVAVDQAISVTTGYGKVGDVVKITVTVSNVGKASTGPSFFIQAPSGTSFVAPDQAGAVSYCEGKGQIPAYYTGETEITCVWESELQPGRSLKREVLVRIDAEPIGANGRAQVHTSEGKDINPKNDTAKVIIKIGTPPAGVDNSGNNGGTGGGLPVTGANVGLIAGIGGAVVLAGAVLFLLARRRKVVA